MLFHLCGVHENMNRFLRLCTFFFCAALFFGCARIKQIIPFPLPSRPVSPKIENLKIKSLDTTSVTIRWVAPGKQPVPDSKECFYEKIAESYRVKYGKLRIADKSWNDESLHELAQLQSPHESGVDEQLTLENLTPDTQYSFGIKYIIKNTCTGKLETSPLSVISFKTVKEKEYKLRPTPLKLGSLRRNGYQVVPVVVYHDIVKTPKRGTDVSLDNFYQQMKYLHDNGYTTISTQQLYNYLNVRSRIPRKSVVLTFDDGYQSMYSHVRDILKKFNFRGIVFVYTDAVVGRYGSTMTWEQIKEISKDVFEIQVHTKSHTNDLALKKEGETEGEYMGRLDSELLFSRNLIENKIGKKAEYLAYPYGTFSERLVNLLRDKYKYKGAFTVIGAEGVREAADEKTVVEYKHNAFFTNPYKIRRIQILRNTSLNKFKRYLKSYKQADVLDKDVVAEFKREINRLNNEF